MNSKAIIFFSILFLFALLLIVVYLNSTDPFKNRPSQKAQTAGQEASNPHAHDPGLTLFEQNCASCHGPMGQGKGRYPALLNNRLSVDQIKAIIHKGKGEMPPFPKFKDQDLTILAQFVRRLQ